MLDRNQCKEPAPLPSFPSKNPYKGTRKVEDEEKIPDEVKKQYVDKILNLVLYDAEDCQALRNFEPIISSTHCIFAKKSVIWGARDYDRKLTIGEELDINGPMCTCAAHVHEPLRCLVKWLCHLLGRQCHHGMVLLRFGVGS